MERAADLLAEYPEIELVRYAAADAGWGQKEAGLVIAAPLEAEEVARWSSLQNVSFMKCLDLRGDAATDQIDTPTPVIKLHELFAALRAERERLAGHVAAARAEITELVARQSQQAQFRPFGWEDLCA
jgi:hypothetical protein